MRRTSFLAAVVIAFVALPAFAQAPASAPPTGTPTGIRGTVDKLADHTLTVKSPDGSSASVTLAPNFTVRTVVAKALSDIKPGDKVAITSVPGPDGTRQAVEVHMLPASMPTNRLGEYPWNLRPDSLMTNAMAAQVSDTPKGRMIKVTLNGRESEITVPPDTPIVGYGPGDASLLKPGTAVFVFARKQPDGSLISVGVTAEKDGVKPPM
jgi:hypothetical protein